MIKKTKASWVDRKLADPQFKAGFELEYEKISIGEQLTRLRNIAHLTQAAVAAKVGTTASAISRYESAEYDRYELQTLQKIVAACGGIMHIVMEPAKARSLIQHRNRITPA
jgi:transcriptional regulator with XRE-family HTH domain